MKKGAIIVGYQGVGKSTACRYELANPKMIDFESSNFKVDGERDPNWYKVYCKIAMSLANQGFIVFTSSHKVVRDEFCYLIPGSDVKMFLLYPSIEMKDEWMKRLLTRYEETGKEKDKLALLNAEQEYNNNIIDMMTQRGDFIHLPIREMDAWPDHKSPHKMYDIIMTAVTSHTKE